VRPADLARGELARLTREHRASRAAIVVLEPRTGRILARVGSGPDGDAQTLRAVETGSTMKALTVAAALEGGLDPKRRFTGEKGAWTVGGHTLRDASPSDWLDARRVLVRSSNVGAGKIAELGTAPLVSLLERLQWRTALAPGADAAPLPPASEWTPGKGFALAAGLGTRATPLHLASAYAALAAGGLFVPPTPDGTGTPVRVLSPETAAEVRGMLEAAVREGTGSGAAVPGVRVGGKTGTARAAATPGAMWGHFVGFAPAEAPRLVVSVSVEVPEGAGYAGGAVAAPAFARLAAALLAAEEQ
jgi:cell division protein FtsI (penicillin-binding protein 3)